jgi:predicted nucleic acid-binding protein
MKNKAHDLALYGFQRDEPLLLDTNVWRYLFHAPPVKPSPHAAAYSAALKAMVTAGSRLVMDVMVLSEYLNAYCRIEWNALHKAVQPNFKKFRKSGSFLSVGQGAATSAREMLKLCARHDHPFATADVTRVLADFEAGSNDFNDGLLAETCRLHGWKIVTHDSDFTTGGIEVLTSNPGLLRACA